MARKLTQKERDEIEAQFRACDTNGDGRISVSELGAVFRSSGRNMTDKELEDLIRSVDLNQNGTVELNEFQDMMSEINAPPMTEAELTEYFKEFDMDGNGFITADEIRQAMKDCGEPVSDKDVQDMIKGADKDGDGRINYEEFVKMVSNK